MRITYARSFGNILRRSVGGGALARNGFAPADLENRLAGESLSPERWVEEARTAIKTIDEGLVA